MYRVAATTSFRARHYIGGPDGNLERPHGHDWKVAATVAAGELDENGWVVDFEELKGALARAVEPLAQSKCINDLAEFGTADPSSERLAEYVYGKLAGQLPQGRELVEVTVWETAERWASYSR